MVDVIAGDDGVEVKGDVLVFFMFKLRVIVD